MTKFFIFVFVED